MMLCARSVFYRFYNNSLKESMAYKQQLENFRKQIRRNQLDELFQNRRAKLLNQCMGSMETEEPSYLKKQHLQVQELRSLAKLSQTQSGIDVINQANYGQRLVQYLSSAHVNTDEQLYATYALCNLSYKSKSAPSAILLTHVLDLLQETTNQNVADNLLSILGNSMSDYQEVKEDLIVKGSLVNRLLALLSRFQNPSVSLCNAISSCTLQMLNRANPHASFIKLRQLLMRFIKMLATAQTLVIIKQSTFSLYLLARMFPLEIADFIFKGAIFERLTELYKQFGEIPFVSFMIKIANAILKEFKGNNFNTQLLPLLGYVASHNFQAYKTSGIHSLTLKMETYKLIYSALELQKLKIHDFLGSELGKRMLATFEIEDDQQIRRELVFIFTPVYLNTLDEEVKLIIEKAMIRARELDKGNFELAGHINQLEHLFRDSQLLR